MCNKKFACFVISLIFCFVNKVESVNNARDAIFFLTREGLKDDHHDNAIKKELINQELKIKYAADEAGDIIKSAVNETEEVVNDVASVIENTPGYIEKMIHIILQVIKLV